jgi:diphthine-ammonia ligase
MKEPLIGAAFCCSWSGGKDSCLAFARAVAAGGRPALLVTMLTESGQRSRSHGLRREVLAAQAEGLGLPLATIATSWADYEASMIELLAQAKAAGCEAAVFGDIDIPRHREWEEMVCAAAGLGAVLPLWQHDRHELLREFWQLGYQCHIVAAREGVVDPALLGRLLDEPLARELCAAGIDACGENGEFHTLVTGGPLFRRPLPVAFGQRVLRDGCWFINVDLMACS